MGSFTLLSVIPVVLLGLVLGAAIGRRLERSARDELRASARVIARVAIEPAVTDDELRRGRIAPATALAISRAIADARADGTTLNIRLRRLDGEPLFSSDLDPAGGFDGSAVAAVRRTGAITRRRTTPTGPVLTTLVPFRGPDGTSAGFLEVERSAREIDREVARARRVVQVIVVAGLSLLYASLMPVLLRASRRMRRHADEIEYRATHDPTTGLPNRALFRDRADRAIAAARRDGDRVGLLLMDIDRFRDINETLGHQVGDALLTQLAGRLEGALKGLDTVARVGGDDFGVLLTHGVDEERLETVVRRIATELERPFEIDGLMLAAALSTGAAVFPEHGADVDELLRNAEIALNETKAGQNGYRLYRPGSRTIDPLRLVLAAELRGASQRGEIAVHYQPKVSVATGLPIGLEALMRWHHPERGMVPPGAFVELAEQTGLIGELTDYILERSLEQLCEWDDLGIELNVAINVSMRSLLDERFPERVDRALRRSGIRPARLDLEMTESTVMTDVERSRRTLDALDALGVRLAIDDFGTGYSSLSYLKSLPVDELKIDREFVMSMTENESDAVIVRSTIELGRNLGLDVVAEGVETEAAWRRLQEFGCHVAQGYYFSKPLPASELTAWLLERCRAAS